MLADQYMKALATVGQSGIGWIDALFKLCVIFLVDLKDLLGISYEEMRQLDIIMRAKSRAEERLAQRIAEGRGSYVEFM